MRDSRQGTAFRVAIIRIALIRESRNVGQVLLQVRGCERTIAGGIILERSVRCAIVRGFAADGLGQPRGAAERLCDRIAGHVVPIVTT